MTENQAKKQKNQFEHNFQQIKWHLKKSQNVDIQMTLIYIHSQINN